jgi:hypothetical protein
MIFTGCEVRMRKTVPEVLTKIPVLLAIASCLRTNLRSVQLCIFNARLTKIEKLKDIKHEYENSRKLARNTQKDV